MSLPLEHLGLLSCSRLSDVLPPLATPKTRARYRRDLREEWAYLGRGETMPEIDAASINWGNKNEARALAEFKMRHDDAEYEVQPFIIHHKMRFFCGTPDARYWPQTTNFPGSVWPGGPRARIGVETKCPWNPAEHEKVLRFGVPEKYRTPLQGYMHLNDAFMWFFVSYDPRRNLDEQYIEIPVKRDDNYINNVLVPGIEEFWEFVISDRKVPAPILDQELVPQVF